MRSRIEVWDNAGRLGYLPAAQEVRVREVLNGEFFVTFKYPMIANDPRYEHLMTGNEIRFPSDVETGQRFMIKRVDEQRQDGKVFKVIEAHHVALQLGQYYFDDYIDFEASQSPLDLLTSLFDGTPFAFTISGPFAAQDIFEWGEKSRLALLHELREVFGAELSYNNTTITFTSRKGANNGATIRYRKNLKGIKRTVQDMDRVTRLYGYGKDGLTIEGHAGHTTKYIDSLLHDPARPFEASMTWPDIDDQARLLTAMQQYLAANEQAKVSYDTETINLTGIGVGDDIRGIDEVLGYDVTTRLLEYERYPFDSSRNPRLVHGNFRESRVSDFILTQRRRQREAQALFERRAAELEQEQQELADAQEDLEDYLEGAFSDGLISEAEAKAIAEHKLQLANEKSDVDAEYSKIYNSLYLTNTTLKTALSTAKGNYDTSYSTLISAINTVIADGSVTPTERTSVNNAFADIATKLTALRQALQDCMSQITQTGIDAVGGKGIQSGGIIRLENRSALDESAIVSTNRAYTDVTGVLNMVDTSALPASNATIDLYYLRITTPSFNVIQEGGATVTTGPNHFWVTWTGKTSTTLNGVRFGYPESATPKLIGFPVSAGMKIFRVIKPTADIVVSATNAVMPDGKYVSIPETRFNGQTLGANWNDFDGWEFRYLYIDASGAIQLASAGTSGGLSVYPPNPPAGSLRIGYLLVGYGTESPNGDLNATKDYDTNGYPVFKERIYHDPRYRDERAIRANASDVAYGGVPYGAQTLAVSVAAGQYQTYYIPVGAGRRSVNLSITLDDGSGYDAYAYGASLTIGRKSANNADGLGRSVWGNYRDAAGNTGHVTGARNASPYGVHILDPRVWNKTYTMLYDADLMPDPSDASRIAIKLTFYNYHSSTAESFSLKLNWHAL